jgi:thymidylate synthase (FAD)
MKVNLISYSQPDGPGHGWRLDKIEPPQSVQDLVAYCARVSNPDNQNNKKTSEKLIKYLIKNKHWSPLEMVSACLEIETTRDIARQILRHRSFSFQEFSQRYADPTKDLTFKTRDARLQDPTNRQNSVELDFTIPADRRLNEDFRMKQMSIWREAVKTYEWAIAKGIAKEQARAVLPEGMTVSRLYMNGTLRSWVHYIDLRSANGTQKEHQDIAVACSQEIAKIFPLMSEL